MKDLKDWESVFKPVSDEEFEEYKKCMDKFLEEARKIDFSVSNTPDFP